MNDTRRTCLWALSIALVAAGAAGARTQTSDGATEGTVSDAPARMDSADPGGAMRGPATNTTREADAVSTSTRTPAVTARPAEPASKRPLIIPSGATTPDGKAPGKNTAPTNPPNRVPDTGDYIPRDSN